MIYYNFRDEKLIIKFLGVKLTIPVGIDSNDSYQVLQWELFEKKFLSLREDCNKILYFGDSIINLLCVEDYLDAINFGIGGETICNAKDKILSLNKYFDRKTLIFSYGINDVICSESVKIIENYEYLINNLPKTSKIFITSILPFSNKITSCFPEGTSNNLIKKVNLDLENLIKNYENISFIDTTKGLFENDFELSEKYTTDGLHLNKDGYKIFLRNLTKSFELVRN